MSFPVTRSDAIFVRWIRCELGLGYPAVTREVGALGTLDAGDPYEYGREVCRLSAAFFGRSVLDPEWQSEGEPVEWSPEDREIRDRFAAAFEIGPKVIPD